jgi:hypothetical protein
LDWPTLATPTKEGSVSTDSLIADRIEIADLFTRSGVSSTRGGTATPPASTPAM